MSSDVDRSCIKIVYDNKEVIVGLSACLLSSG